MNLKKRILISAASLFVIGIIVSGFYGVSNVIASQTSPNMKAIIKSKNINTINSMNFNIDIEINPGEVKVDDYKNQEIYLSFSNDNIFKLISASENGENIDINADENKIKLENFDYKKDGEVYKATPKNIRLTFKANGKGISKGELSLDKNLKLNYTDAKGNKIENISLEFDDGRKSLDIKTDTLNYQAKNIIGFENDPPTEVTSGSVVDLEYKINAGDLKVAYNEKYEGEMISELESKKRIIYVVEQSVLDEQSANGEIARDSIIMGLENLKKKNPSIETSLIAYGENASVVQTDKKDFYSADQLIDNLRALELKDENGNLGEALKKAKILANSDSSYETSIVLVSAGNPLYITEKNNEMLVTFSDEKGEAKFSEELAGEYANKIANEIAVETNNNIRWFGINYGVGTAQNIPTEIVEKLGGKASTVKKPYSDDFIAITDELVSDFIVKGNVSIELLNTNLTVEEELKEIPMDFTYNVRRDEVGNAARDEEGNIIFDPTKIEQIVNLPLIISGSEKIDLANTENIKITYKTSSLGAKNQEKVYNEENIVSRDLDIKSNFEVKKKGFNTGRKRGNIIQEVDSANLAIENSFSLAFEVKANNNFTVESFVSGTGSEKIEQLEIKAFEIDEATGVLSEKSTLSADKTYVICADYYINSNPKNGFENIEVGLRINEENITIPIKIVNKPNHF